MLKKLRLRLLKPFNNKRGGMNSLLIGILSSFASITLFSYILVRGLESYAQSRADTLCYKFSDAISSSGELNDGIQTEIFKGFEKLRFYTGDYTIEVYKYDSKNYFAKEFVASSENGDKMPTVAIPRGQMVQVIYKSDETTLDKVASILDNKKIKVGLASESSSKVN